MPFGQGDLDDEATKEATESGADCASRCGCEAQRRYGSEENSDNFTVQDGK
jgi:hypothetical protein